VKKRKDEKKKKKISSLSYWMTCQSRVVRSVLDGLSFSILSIAPSLIPPPPRSTPGPPAHLLLLSWNGYDTSKTITCLPIIPFLLLPSYLLLPPCQQKDLFLFIFTFFYPILVPGDTVPSRLFRKYPDAVTLINTCLGAKVGGRERGGRPDISKNAKKKIIG